MCVLLNVPCVMKAMDDSIIMSEHLRPELSRLHPSPQHPSQRCIVGGLVKPVCRANKTIQKARHSDGCVSVMASSSFLDNDHANSNLNLGDQRWLTLLPFLKKILRFPLPSVLLRILCGIKQSHKSLLLQRQVDR